MLKLAFTDKYLHHLPKSTIKHKENPKIIFEKYLERKESIFDIHYNEVA